VDNKKHITIDTEEVIDKDHHKYIKIFTKVIIFLYGITTIIGMASTVIK